MSNRTVTYTAGEIGRVRVIEDFLPSPADLVPREENVKVTLLLSRRSLDFFKREARKHRVPYQRMIRALVDTYAERQVGGKSKSLTRNGRT
jgi:predicted DNA binding CopG/RHH family protein